MIQVSLGNEWHDILPTKDIKGTQLNYQEIWMFLQIHKNSTSRDVFFIIYLISRKYVENATLQLWALVQNRLEAYVPKKSI